MKTKNPKAQIDWSKTPLKDATRDMLLTITDRDIEGASRVVDNCPLARCGKLVFPYFRVGVDISHVGTFTAEGEAVRLRYRTSTFAAAFDKATEAVKQHKVKSLTEAGIQSGTYRFTAPTESQTLQAKRKSNRLQPKTKRTIRQRNMKSWQRGRLTKAA